MFRFMQTVTSNALRTMNSICIDQMSPFPIVFTLRNTWVHVSTTNCSNIASNIEASIDEIFGFGTTLYIPNVKPYDDHIQFRKDLDNSWSRHNNNIIENMVILDYSFDQIG